MVENFVTASRSRCERNSSTVELVDYTYDGRRAMARRSMLSLSARPGLLNTRRSTVTPLLH